VVQACYGYCGASVLWLLWCKCVVLATPHQVPEDARELVFDPRTDDFLRRNLYRNYGEASGAEGWAERFGESAEALRAACCRVAAAPSFRTRPSTRLVSPGHAASHVFASPTVSPSPCDTLMTRLRLLPLSFFPPPFPLSISQVGASVKAMVEKFQAASSKHTKVRRGSCSRHVQSHQRTQCPSALGASPPFVQERLREKA
jgi:hypothetical protein